jgi:hypothetical protein
VDSVQFPAFRRWVFDKVGVFDERLVRNQDDELSFRIVHGGGYIFVSPRIRYLYYVRTEIRQLFRQYFQYGFWRIPVIEKHGRPTTLRQLAPLVFYLSVLVIGGIAAWFDNLIVAGLLPAGYALALVLAAVASARSVGPKVAALLPIAIATMHAGYAAGSAFGIVSRLCRLNVWDPKGRMSAITR